MPICVDPNVPTSRQLNMGNVEIITINGLVLRVVFVHLKLIQVTQCVESTIELMKANVLLNVLILQLQEEDSVKTNVTVITTLNLSLIHI